MKQTDKSADGTSFHNHTFTATVDDLRNVLGQPKFESNDGQDKVNFDWIMETEDGEPFTVYDWKEYRPLPEDEVIDVHALEDAPGPGSGVDRLAEAFPGAELVEE
jgi:hypothetical protein